MLTFWLPLPIGLPLFLLGIALLMRSSPQIRARIMQFASQHPRVARFMQKIAGPDSLEEESSKE